MTMTDERLAELDAVMARVQPILQRMTDTLNDPVRDSAALLHLNNYALDAVAIALASIPDLRAHIDAQAATIARVIGAAKSLLALCEQAGLADDLLATIYPDSKNRSGQTRDETAKQARRTMNEARAALGAA